MNSPHTKTRMNSRVVLSFIYSAASIKVSVWGSGSLTAGLAATAMVVFMIDAAVASLLLKRRRDRSPKILGGRLSMRGDSRVGCCLGAGDARSRHIFEFVFFLILIEESLL